jgi:hypothetical protein
VKRKKHPNQPHHPAPTNMLERIVEKAAKDPAHHGEMFRMLLDSELVLIIPADQPLVQQGAASFQAENPLVVSRFADQKGPFFPVFTSEAAAERRMAAFPDVNSFRIAALSARVALQLINDGETPVRLISQGPANFFFPPEAVRDILDGKLSNADPDEGEKQMLTLQQIDYESLPSDLVAAIRRFCDARPVPLGVYAYVAKSTKTGEWDTGTIHFFLWLRETDPSFYNDFNLLTQSFAKGFHIITNVADTDMLAFLRSSIPLWPQIADAS